MSNQKTKDIEYLIAVSKGFVKLYDLYKGELSYNNFNPKDGEEPWLLEVLEKAKYICDLWEELGEEKQEEKQEEVLEKT